jgi:hypothetical protein
MHAGDAENSPAVIAGVEIEELHRGRRCAAVEPAAFA